MIGGSGLTANSPAGPSVGPYDLIDPIDSLIGGGATPLQTRMIHTVEQGDCISSIGLQYGFFWKTLWDLPENADLKSLRKNPNVLLTGDQVTIPDLTIKKETRPTNAKHQFIRKGVPEKLRIKLMDANHQPRANLDYIIFIDGDSRRGKTTSAGELIESIPPDAQEAKLILDGDNDNPLTINLGHLNPVTEVSGVKGRLTNLGFYKGPVDENVDDALKKALMAFQTKQGLNASGQADDATRAQLLKVHGH